jgi:hypothetical protein
VKLDPGLKLDRPLTGKLKPLAVVTVRSRELESAS